jgi:hypothetical protein
MKNKSNAILDESEMLEWYSDDTNHYEPLIDKDNGVVMVIPFSCDFEVTDKEGNIKLRGVKGQGLGYDLETKQLIVIERKENAK